MLGALTIQNVVLIEKLDLAFDGGLVFLEEHSGIEMMPFDEALYGFVISAEQRIQIAVFEDQ